MAEITPKDTIKSWFKRGLKPLESQFHAWLDSYWHKSEKLSVSNIDKLETILNKKAESATVDQLGKNFNAHIQDTSLHKTEEERYQLGHLARDPEATYAKKEDVKYIEPLILHAIYTVDAETGKRTYTFPEDERSLVVDYFDNQDARLVVLFVSETEESAEYESYVMTESEIRSVNRVMQFGRIHSPESSNFNCYYRLMLQYTQPPEGDAVGFVLSGIEVDFIADPVEFYVRAEKEGDKYAYTLEEGQKEVFADYFLNKAAHRNATLRITRTDTGGHDTLGLTWRRSPGEGKTGTYQLVFNRMSLDGTEGMSTFILSSACTSHPETWTDILLSTDEYGMGGGEPVVFTGTVTISGTDKTYVLDEGQDLKFTRYFDNGMSSPVLLKFLAADKYSHNEVFVLQDTSIDGASRTMNFARITSGLITRMYLQLSRVSSGAWSGTLTPRFYEYKFGESEYKYDRYFGTEIDMNECTESGGIYVISTEEVPSKVQNGPGFTSFNGFVLKSPGALTTACTQVVSDKETGKIMMRSSFLSADFMSREWSEWKEIGVDASSKPVVFTGTCTIEGTSKTYSMDAGQENTFAKYFDEGMTSPVILKFVTNDTHTHSEIFVLQNTSIDGSGRTMNFARIKAGTITRMYLMLSKTSAGAWGGTFTPKVYDYKFEESEYKAERYFPDSAFDMNDWFESGGISVITDDTIVGTNIPAGFTKFSGYVLAAIGVLDGRKYSAVQVVSDRQLGKTMIRTGDQTSSGNQWSEWKEIGGAPAGDNVYVVQEYPSDLSQYADGSIFIKEEATV